MIRGLRNNRIFGRKNRAKPMDSSRILVIGFIIVISIGTLLLSLPLSSASGQSTPFINSLFTATSATCVTGLVTYDTGTYWSLFGQIVIILLIQIGGLGFMTMASLFSMLFRKRVSYKDRLRTAAALNLYDSADFSRLIKHIVAGTFIFEGCGALILSIRFIPDFGFFGGIYRGIFIAISAFCNAGFDLMGVVEPNSSLAMYRGDVTVNITVMLLIIIGGLGFFVWEEVFSGKPFKSFSLFTKMVLMGTLVLLVFGAVSFALLEYIDPAALEDLSFGEKILAALFNSVTLRTAGFATVDYGVLKELTLVISILLMFIGGVSGSTAGGVKVSTVGVLFFAILSVIKGNTKVTVNKRNIAWETVFRALTLVCISMITAGTACFIISALERLPFITVLFECVSALCTVGLTMGITSSLSGISLLILAGLMFFGRVGFFTVTCALFIRQNNDELLDYPDAHILIG